MTNQSEPHCVWDVSAEVGEGVIWSPEEQAIYFVDSVKRHLHRLDANGARKTWDTPSDPGFLALRRGGGLICGLRGGIHAFDPADGRFELLAPVDVEQPERRINDGFVDPGGRLWFGTIFDPGDQEWHVDDDGEVTGLVRDPRVDRLGTLVSLESDGQLVVRDHSYAVPNGPVTSRDGRTLYHSDSMDHRIFAFDLAKDGSMSNRRVFMTFPDDVYPDGMAVDEADNIWVALFNGEGLEQYSATGEKLTAVPFPCIHLTNPAFGGPDRRTLYVTTARVGLRPKDLERQPLAGGLFTLRVDTPGLPNTAW